MYYLNIGTEPGVTGLLPGLLFPLFKFRKDCCCSSQKLDFRSLLKDEIINYTNKVTPEAGNRSWVSKMGIQSLKEGTHQSPKARISLWGKKKNHFPRTKKS